MNIFDIVLINPILNILVAVYQGLTALHVPSALGFSIILLTIIIRLILSPLLHQSLKQQKKMQQIMPEINKLKEKHKNDSKRLQMEQMALFQQHGVNPASGCFVMVIQIPILIALYQVLLGSVCLTTKGAKSLCLPTADAINHRLYFDGLKLHEMWNTSFFGLSLGHTPSQLISQVGFGLILVCVLTAALQLIQSKMMMAPAADAPKPVKKNNDQPDFATTFQTQSMYLLPIMVGFFSFNLPFGLSLYWNTLTIFGIIQQYMIQQWGGLVDWFPFLKKSE
ncbi:MAG TPA: YidC/Oxa1 family membrane protein insertase [Candidatus Saccharimonadales bacterium]|nr:YidC/Oxa1 family membrane protein insertase [Candidatus Saccharimonadales bacterium]